MFLPLKIPVTHYASDCGCVFKTRRVPAKGQHALGFLKLLLAEKLVCVCVYVCVHVCVYVCLCIKA